MDNKTNINELKEKVKKFCQDRDWDQFHTTKDIAIGIITEASELLEPFRFKSDKQIKEILNDPKKREHISEELADVFMYILRFAQVHNIDLTTAFNQKIEKQHKKYPIEKSKGNNKKYTEF